MHALRILHRPSAGLRARFPRVVFFFEKAATFAIGAAVLVSEPARNPRPNQMTDNKQTQSARTGAQEPARQLLELMAPMHERARMTARRLCRSDAEGDDLFQDAALRALAKLPSLRDDKAFPAWFYRILLSLHKNRVRSHFWRRLLPLESLFGASGGEPVGDDGGTWEEVRHGQRRMRAALETLPAVQREAVVLFDIDGHSLAEIADMQGASLSAVKSRLVRGRARLRKYYRARGYGSAIDTAGSTWSTTSNMAEKRNAS